MRPRALFLFLSNAASEFHIFTRLRVTQQQQEETRGSVQTGYGNRTRRLSRPGREITSRCRRRIYRSAKSTALLCIYRHIRRAASVSRPRDRGRCQRDAEALPPLRARYKPPTSLSLVDESDVGASRLLLKTGSILKRF